MNSKILLATAITLALTGPGQAATMTIPAFNVNHTAGSAPLNVEFTARATKGSGTQVLKYLWDFDGDGVMDQETAAGKVSHTYTDDGLFFPTVQAVNDLNDSVTTYLGRLAVMVRAGVELSGKIEHYEYDEQQGAVNAKVRVYNTGSVASAPSRVTLRVYDTGGSPTTLAYLSLKSLNPGADTLLNFTASFQDDVYERYVAAVVDALNRNKNEVSEANNSSKVYMFGPASAQLKRNCKTLHDVDPDLPSGIYLIDPDGKGSANPLSVYCDMTTDGGGWTLVLAYNHLGGENKDLVLGAPLDPVTGYAHFSNAMMKPLAYGEARFYCTTSGHSRVMNFKTQNVGALKYLKTGGANAIVNWASGTTKLEGHTAYLPDATTHVFSGMGDYAMTNHIFYKGGTYHWNLRYIDVQGGRWECDDWPGNNSKTTLHQIWVR